MYHQLDVEAWDEEDHLRGGVGLSGSSALASAQVDIPKALTFDAASVKRNTSGESRTGMGRAPTGITFINVTLLRLLQSAFALQDFQMSEDRRGSQQTSLT